MKRNKRPEFLGCLSIALITALCTISRAIDSRGDEILDKKLEIEKPANQEIEISELGNTGTIPEIEILQAASIKTSSVQTLENTYAMISTLDYEDDWVFGKTDDTYLSLNHLLSIESNNYRVVINKNTHRMIVTKYDQDFNKLGHVDLCNGDIFNIDDSVRYITISIYKYEKRQVKKHSNREMLSELKNGLKFTITKIDNIDEHVKDKEMLTAEIHLESLSNYSNYRKGWYKSWGGQYEHMAGRLCTRNLYKVDDKPYVVNINDSRIAIAISEFNAEGKWIKYSDTFLNGYTFKKQPSTAYIAVTVRSLKWGADLSTVFNNGLIIDLASDAYMDKEDTILINKADFSNEDHWIAGSYLYETGAFIIEPNKICFDSLCWVDDDEYMVNLPGGYLKMNILELNENGKVVKSNDLQSGQLWKKSATTDKITITVYGSGKTFTVTDYKNMISGYSKFGLEKYIRYTHNTQMKDMTAGEFINKVNVGWNLGNSLDSKAQASSQTANLKQELNWGNPYITKDLIDYVTTSGFNTIRIPVTWYYNTYTDANGVLKINEDWLNRVQDVVDYAVANGLYVILNTHHEQPIIYAGTDDHSMKKVLVNAQAIWAGIAEHFKTYDDHLIFESYNEVDNIEKSWNYSDKAAAQMNLLNQIFVDTVRGSGGNNAKRILIVPTLLNGADYRFYSAFQMPKDTVSDKIVVQVHTYSKKFNQDIESDFAQLQEFSQKISAPIVIGEFGTTTNYPFPELREEHAANFVARAAKFGIKCIWWDNGSDYKIIDRKELSNSNMQMISALIEGSHGIAYEVEQGMVFNTIEQFAFRTPNIITGNLENTFWGTLVTDNAGSAVTIPKASICTISLTAKNEVADVWLQRVLFYNTSGGLVQSGKEIQSLYYIGTVPENSVAIRVSFNSPKVSTTLEYYKKYLLDKKIELVVRCFNISDVKKVKLTATPYK